MANILYRGAAAPTVTNSAGANNGPLTNDQIDKNFFALDSAKFEKSGGTVSGATTFSSNVTISGNLTVDGTTTTINTATLSVDDKNIELGDVASPSNTTASGGGITLKAGTDGDKSIIWDSTNANWTSSEHWNIASGKSFKIANTAVLNGTTLGSGVINSSLTKLGTTAGFVKSDANGALSSDTNTYLTSAVTTFASINSLSQQSTARTGAIIIKAGTSIGIVDNSGTYTISAADAYARFVSLQVRTTDPTNAAFAATGTYTTANNNENLQIVKGTGIDVNIDTNSGALKFSTTYGTTATTACVGNDSRLSNARSASDVYAWAKASTKPSYSSNEITENSNLYFTDARARGAISVSGSLGYDSSTGVISYSTPASLPASDVYAWAKAATKPSYSYSEISNTPTIPTTLPASDVYAWAKAATKPSYSYSEISGTPASLPASDVYAWAKAATKPSYAFNEISSGTISATSGTFSGALASGVDGDAGGGQLSLYGVYGRLILTPSAGSTPANFSSGGASGFTFKYSTDTYCQISSNGIVTNSNVTAYGSPSDRNLKENIQPLTNSLEKVKALQGVSFDWKKDTPEHTLVGMTHDIGLIAQNVQEVLPELVREGEDGFLSLRDRGLVAVLIEAIKELNAKVEDLQNQLANK
jgi:hypothetical protein